MTTDLRAALLAARAFAIQFAAAANLECEGHIPAHLPRIRSQAQLMAALRHFDEVENAQPCAATGCGHALGAHDNAGGACLTADCACEVFRE